MERRVGARSGWSASKTSGLRSRQTDEDRPAPGLGGIQTPDGRKNPASQKATGIENLLRYALLRKGINFIEQASIGPWSIDFLLPDYMACVEADGEFWHSSPSARMKDRRKDAWLKSRGYMVFHFDGWEIKQDSDFCVSRMMKSIEGKMNNLVQSIAEEEESSVDQPSMEAVIDEQPRATEEKNDEYEQWLSGNR
jgi:very-short-patch-repair endonuclease